MWSRKSIPSLEHWNRYDRRTTLIEAQELKASSPADEKCAQEMLGALKKATANGFAAEGQSLDRMKELKDEATAARVAVWSRNAVVPSEEMKETDEQVKARIKRQKAGEDVPIHGQKTLTLAMIYEDLYDDNQYLKITPQTMFEKAKVMAYQLLMIPVYAAKAKDVKGQVAQYCKEHPVEADVARAAIEKMKVDELKPVAKSEKAAAPTPSA